MFKQRLTDLQRAMEDLAAKLHEAEFSKAQWLAIVDIPFDQIPQQKANLKVGVCFNVTILKLSLNNNCFLSRTTLNCTSVRLPAMQCTSTSWPPG